MGVQYILNRLFLISNSSCLFHYNNLKMFETFLVLKCKSHNHLSNFFHFFRVSTLRVLIKFDTFTSIWISTVFRVSVRSRTFTWNGIMLWVLKVLFSNHFKNRWAGEKFLKFLTIDYRTYEGLILQKYFCFNWIWIIRNFTIKIGNAISLFKKVCYG